MIRLQAFGVVLLLIVGGCVFDGSGIGPQASRDTGMPPDGQDLIDLSIDGEVDSAQVIEGGIDVGDTDLPLDTSLGDSNPDHVLHDLVSHDASHWYSTWAYRMKITIDHTKVAGNSSLPFFPVLLRFHGDSVNGILKSVRNKTQIIQIDGKDILFTASDGLTKLAHEIERYESETGALIVWVKIPSLSPSVDTEIFIYYGNMTASDQQNATAVWNEGGTQAVKGVWHLAEEPVPHKADAIKDSTSFASHGTPDSSFDTKDLVNGKIGKGIETSDDHAISVGDGSNLDVTGNLTISYWAKISVLASWANPLFRTDNDMRTYLCFYSKIGELGLSTTYDGETMYTDLGFLSVNPADNAWHHWAIIRDFDVGKISFYKDGAFLDMKSIPQGKKSAVSTPHSETHIGDTIGILDEMRISATVRDAAWIKTGYTNQNAPESFYRMSTEQIPWKRP